MNDLLKYEAEPGLDHPPVPESDYLYFMSIAEDDGAMWLATYGLGVYRYDGGKLTHYPVQSGGETVTLYSVYKDRQGGIWLGTHEHGAWKFNGREFERFQPGGLV